MWKVVEATPSRLEQLHNNNKQYVSLLSVLCDCGLVASFDLQYWQWGPW